MNQNEIYDKVWREIDGEDPRPFLEFKTNLIKDYLESNKGIALDMGCGDGFFTLKLLKFGYEVNSIDVSPEAIKSTKNRVQKIGMLNSVKLFKEDFFKFEPENQYDIILCLEVLEHINDDVAALKKINKLLKDNGTLILSVPHRQDLWNYSDEMGGHYRRYSKNDVLSKLEKTNFKVEKLFDYGFPFIRCFVNGLCVRSAKKNRSQIGPPKNNPLNRIASKFIKYMCKIDLIFINNNKGINLVAIAKKL
jgi:2-polyprenyl-3-methyl-5-hydroxy-6-metoxy-1,4-benzoquinol methylase